MSVKSLLSLAFAKFILLKNNKWKNNAVNTQEKIMLNLVNKAQDICNVSIKYDFGNRRLGDSDIVVANSELAKELMSWEAKYSDLDTIIKSTWSVYKSRRF